MRVPIDKPSRVPLPRWPACLCQSSPVFSLPFVCARSPLSTGPRAAPQVMEPSRLRALQAMTAILNHGIAAVHEYNGAHPDFVVTPGQRQANPVQSTDTCLSRRAHARTHSHAAS